MLNYDKNKNIQPEVTPLLNITLWPNRSLSKKSFYTIMLVTFGAMMITIIPFIGTTTFYIMLPFSSITLITLFLSIRLNYQSGNIYENIRIWPNRIEVKRFEINGTSKEWNANPYWTKVNLYRKGQKIQNYLTLTGNGREVEVGAFLAPNERVEIKQKIDTIFKQIY